MDKNMTINITILQRPYTLRVKCEEEEVFRQANRSIEKSIQKYANKSVGYRDKQDLLALSLIESTVIALKNEKKVEELTLNENLKTRLCAIDELLSAE